MKSIVVHRLRNGSIYRLSAIGAVFGMIPLFTVFGILASMNLVKLTWNSEAVTGPRALIVGPLMGVLFAAICIALFGSVLALGLWIYSKFRPLTLEYDEMQSLAGVASTDG
jgi:hypothetical protein